MCLSLQDKAENKCIVHSGTVPDRSLPLKATGGKEEGGGGSREVRGQFHGLGQGTSGTWV